MPETPAQTFERITREKWPGDTSFTIKSLLCILRINALPGSESANLQLQTILRELAGLGFYLRSE